VTIWEVSKKLARVPKTVLCSSRKSPEMDVFRKKIKFEPVWPKDLPWWCYALNYGQYVEEGPLEWQNVSFWLPFEHVIVCYERHGTWTVRSKNQWKPHKMSSTRILWQSGRFPKNWAGCRKPCAIAHENRPKRTFSGKNKIRTRLAQRPTVVVL
jgi:hypothetical protein